jgi:hypothetical protein
VQSKRVVASTLAIAIALSGCAAPPPAPMQMMPAPNKPFDVFVADQANWVEQTPDTQLARANAVEELSQTRTSNLELGQLG